MSEQPWGVELVTDEDAGCQFPTGHSGVCGRPVVRSGAPGRPGKYCESPGHTRVRAFAARRELERASAPGRQRGGELVADRPVSHGRASLEALLARFEQVATEHREQLGVILAQAGELLATVGDADAAAYEVAEAHRAAEIQIAQAQTAQDSAERAATAARRDAATAIEAQAQADAAAEDALAQLDAVRAQTAEQLAQYQATTEAALAERRAARAELEEVRAAATTAVTAAQDAAERQVREIIAERDRMLAERETETRQRIAQAHADAQEKVTAMRSEIDAAKADAERQVRTLREELTDATSVATRAQTEHAAAERAAAEDRATLTRLRSELDDARRQHHEELSTLRHEARTDRDQLRTDHAEQLRDIRHATEDRVRALTRALELAQTTTDSHRAQLTDHTTTATSEPLEGIPPAEDASTTHQPSDTTRRRHRPGPGEPAMPLTRPRSRSEHEG